MQYPSIFISAAFVYLEGGDYTTPLTHASDLEDEWLDIFGCDSRKFTSPHLDVRTFQIGLNYDEVDEDTLEFFRRETTIVITIYPIFSKDERKFYSLMERIAGDNQLSFQEDRSMIGEYKTIIGRKGVVIPHKNCKMSRDTSEWEWCTEDVWRPSED